MTQLVFSIKGIIIIIIIIIDNFRKVTTWNEKTKKFQEAEGGLSLRSRPLNERYSFLYFLFFSLSVSFCLFLPLSFAFCLFLSFSLLSFILYGIFNSNSFSGTLIKKKAVRGKLYGEWA